MTLKQEEKILKRYEIFNQVFRLELTLKQAALLLNLSYRHTKRLYKKYFEKGITGLKPKIPKFSNSLKFNMKFHEKIISFYDEIYDGFNLLHFKEKLEENHKIIISYESLRQIMIKQSRHKSKKRKRQHRQRRPRMPKTGMLIQMDSSEHKWLSTQKGKYWLVYGIDDADNTVPCAKFIPADTTFANMDCIQAILLKKGLFGALYVDKASHFTTTRHGGLHNKADEEQGDTNIETSLKDLGITLITANSPQAKGRVERMFRFFQDRLINEMRLNKIQNYDEANHFLKTDFLPWYNMKYNKNRKAESVYKQIPKGTDLNMIFSLREIRTVNKDNTITFYNQIIQLPATKKYISLTQRKVEVRLNGQRELYILYKNDLILKTTFLGETKRIQILNREFILQERKII